MNTKDITGSILGFLIASMTIMSAQAQMENTAEPHSVSLADSIAHPIRLLDQHGTGELQDKVLMQINGGLVNGWLSPFEAGQYKNQLNKLNEQESWYKSLNNSIPNALTEKNKILLNEMSRKLQPKPLVSASTKTALHADIDEMISKALARNYISDSQAQSYYLRLAQIESNLESTKLNSVGLSDQAAATNKKLHDLKSELTHKVGQAQH